MQEILPYLINGISVGGQYALIAIGYTLVYGILRLINFAHGDVFMVAGLIMVYATSATASTIMTNHVCFLLICFPPHTLSVTFSPNRPVGRTHSTTISRAKVNASEKVV